MLKGIVFRELGFHLETNTIRYLGSHCAPSSLYSNSRRRHDFNLPEVPFHIHQVDYIPRLAAHYVAEVPTQYGIHPMDYGGGQMEGILDVGRWNGPMPNVLLGKVRRLPFRLCFTTKGCAP